MSVPVLEKVRLEELINLRKCRKSFEFNELSLNYKGFESAKVIKKAIDNLKRLKVFTEAEALKVVNEVFEEYSREGFDFQYQYEQALERDLIRVKRIIKYIFENEYSILETDVQFIFPLCATYRGYQIKYVADVVDFVFGRGNEVFLVKIRSGENPYSHRARKKENHVENSMELLGTAMGLHKRYAGNGKIVYVESWYIKNKDDKPDDLIPVFEHKKEKNIARITVPSDPKVLKERFYAVAAFPEGGPEKCDTCIHRCVCMASYNHDVKLDLSTESVEKKSDGVKLYTESQKAVVEHMEGPMCVIAGPGSGKTFALVERLANMLKKGINPENILFVTFTNKAAEEIRTRVKAILNTDNDKLIPNIYTFNALGYNILKENPMLLGIRVKLADKVDRYMLISDVLKKAPKIKNVSYDGIYGEYGLIKRLDQWFLQIEKQGTDAFREQNAKKDCEGILTVYEMYKRLFDKKGFIDFDMQISLVNKLFQKYPKLAAAYARKFKYIMVDEFQDTSEDQAKMIYAIAKHHNNIVVVGDDDQSIYGWRGGSNKFILNFEKDFPSAKIVIMNDNFRSTDTILQAANSVIADNGNRYEKKIIGHKSGTYQPIYFQNCTADSVVYLIGEILKKGYQLGDIAVLGRNHSRLNEVVNALEGKYKVFAQQFLYEDIVFSTIYDVLTLYFDGMDNDVALYRYLRRMGIQELKKGLKQESLYKNLVESKQLLPIDTADPNSFETYIKAKDVSVMMNSGYKLFKCFKLIQKKVLVLNELINELYGINNHVVIDQLNDIAEKRAIVTMAELYEFMSCLVLFQDERAVEYEPQKDAVQILTAHSAKGKEFPVVIIYGTEDFRDEEEEVRLFYVSITRAKKALFFLETVCNSCEILPRLKESVIIK